VQEDVEVVAAAAGVSAEEAGLVGFLDGAREDCCFVVEFAADVDVGCRALLSRVSMRDIILSCTINMRSSFVQRQDILLPAYVDPCA
jgi:hypothetical protein